MTGKSTYDVLVVGSGVAGLAAARRLKDAGAAPLVLGRGRGLGGRCATWRLDGQPVDYGVCFLHGSEPQFVDAIRAVPGATVVPGWPRRVEGRGTPCQPRAFVANNTRLAYAEGVSVFPKWLAHDLEVRREVDVQSVRVDHDRLTVRLSTGEELSSRDVVLAMAGPQAEAFLLPLVEVSPEVDAARRLLGMLSSLPSLTVMAAYDHEAPAFDILYPEDSKVLQIIAHDSSKRVQPRELVLVLQAHPGWSRRHLDEPPEVWQASLLEEAGRLVGAWARSPRATRPHTWRYARVDAGSELSQPLLLPLPGGLRLGVAGELFAPGGGVEAAWLSGHRLAGRIIESRTP